MHRLHSTEKSWRVLNPPMHALSDSCKHLRNVTRKSDAFVKLYEAITPNLPYPLDVIRTELPPFDAMYRCILMPRFVKRVNAVTIDNSAGVVCDGSAMVGASSLVTGRNEHPSMHYIYDHARKMTVSLRPTTGIDVCIESNGTVSVYNDEHAYTGRSVISDFDGGVLVAQMTARKTFLFSHVNYTDMRYVVCAGDSMAALFARKSIEVHGIEPGRYAGIFMTRGLFVLYGVPGCAMVDRRTNQLVPDTTIMPRDEFTSCVSFIGHRTIAITMPEIGVFFVFEDPVRIVKMPTPPALDSAGDEEYWRGFPYPVAIVVGEHNMVHMLFASSMRKYAKNIISIDNVHCFDLFTRE